MRGGGSFSADELQMLRKLPAVANATKDRITYADTFKRVCVIRYLAGESPTKIFREAGLPPELIGYKRIERSVARWKKSAIKSVNGSEGMGNSEIIAQLIELFVDTMKTKKKLDNIVGITTPNASAAADASNAAGVVGVPAAVGGFQQSSAGGLDSETAHQHHQTAGPPHRRAAARKRRPPRQTRRADRLARSFFIMPASVPPNRAGKRHLSDKSGRIGRFPR